MINITIKYEILTDFFFTHLSHLLVLDIWCLSTPVTIWIVIFIFLKAQRFVGCVCLWFWLWGFYFGLVFGCWRDCFMPSCIRRITKHKCQEVMCVLELGCKPYFILSSVAALLEFIVLCDKRMILIWCISIRGENTLIFVYAISSSELWWGSGLAVLLGKLGTCACH